MASSEPKNVGEMLTPVIVKDQESGIWESPHQTRVATFPFYFPTPPPHLNKYPSSNVASALTPVSPTPMGSTFSRCSRSGLLVILLSWERGSSLEPSPISEVLCSDALEPSERTSPQLPTPALEVPVSVQLQPTSYRKSAFPFLPRAKGRGKPPTPLHARTHTPPDTSEHPPSAKPTPSPGALSVRVPGLSPGSRFPSSEQRLGV